MLLNKFLVYQLALLFQNVYEIRTRNALDRETRAEHRLRIICEEDDQATALLRHSGTLLLLASGALDGRF